MRIINLDKIISNQKFPHFIVLSVLVMCLASTITVFTAEQQRINEVLKAEKEVTTQAKTVSEGGALVAKSKVEEASRQIERVTEETKTNLPEAQLASDSAEDGADSQAAVSQTVVSQELASQIAESEALIQPGAYPVMGLSSVTVDQMVAYYEANTSYYPGDAMAAGGAPDIQSLCQIYYEEATAEGVRPEVAFVQSMKETGWLQYGGDSTIQQYNFAGLGTTGGGVQGVYFPDVRTGVRAQIQHLKAYATEEPLSQDCVDERYDFVAKGCAPYVEWLGQQENPQGYGWATGAEYGTSIVSMISILRGY